MATSDGQRLSLHRGMGHVADVFSPAQLDRLGGTSAIGHVRYSTSGASLLKNAQPIAVDYARGSMAVAHNGNLTNAEMLHERLEERGSIFQSGSDTEVVVHLVALSSERSLEDRLADALAQVEGAYSLLCLTNEAMIAVRDPRGIRPLCLGVIPGEKPSYAVSSEPASFDLIGARMVREIAPGEMLTIDERGLHVRHPFQRTQRKLCLFEYVYFSRPDSSIGAASVYEARKEMGRVLAEEHPVEADIVIPVPDSGVAATLGYAERSGTPFEMGLVRSHYVGRTFIEPQQSIRHFGVRLKLNPVRAALDGRRVVVVDDSIVRGTTSRKIVTMLRAAGAREVHMRISSPPTRWPCYYGIDTPTREELIASTHSVEEINEYITSDSLAYLGIEGAVRAVDAVRRREAKPDPTTGSAADAALHLPVATDDDGSADSFCHACWSGEYPIPYRKHHRPRQMRLLDL